MGSPRQPPAAHPRAQRPPRPFSRGARSLLWQFKLLQEKRKLDAEKISSKAYRGTIASLNMRCDRLAEEVAERNWQNEELEMNLGNTQSELRDATSELSRLRKRGDQQKGEFLLMADRLEALEQREAALRARNGEIEATNQAS